MIPVLVSHSRSLSSSSSLFSSPRCVLCEEEKEEREREQLRMKGTQRKHLLLLFLPSPKRDRGDEGREAVKNKKEDDDRGLGWDIASILHRDSVRSIWGIEGREGA